MSRVKRIWCAMIFFGLKACAPMESHNASFQGSPYFEDPPSQVSFSDKEMFNQALSLQYKGQLRPAINFWQRFLAEHPKSFEALNNLGMAYYSNDELDQAIQSFETALGLKPGSARIKKNLRRTLRFRVTLHKENREYLPAIKDLEEISNLSSRDREEKVLREIEDLQDKIFSEVERLNTAEDYQDFLGTYPSGFYADKARDKLKALAPKAAEVPSEKLKEFLPALVPESTLNEKKEQTILKTPTQEAESTFPDTPFMEEQPPPPVSETIAKSERLSGKPTDLITMKPTLTTKPPMMGTGMVVEKSTIEEPVATPALEEPLIPETQLEPRPVAKPTVRKIRVITKSSVLNIRAQPSLQARIVGKLKKGAEVRVIDETSNWYRVVYAPRQDGWISKRFSKEIE